MSQWAQGTEGYELPEHSRAMQHNISPISLREAKVFLDGYEVMDGVSVNINVDLETWSGKQLGQRSNSTRWLAVNVSGDITRYATTSWTEGLIKGYLETGKTPEFTITGIVEDTGSDFYANYGKDVITVVGCVFTGTLPLLKGDVGGDVRTDTLSFNGAKIAA